MRILFTFVLSLGVIFNSSECSSHSGGNPHSDSNPGPSSSGKQHTTIRTSTPERLSRSRSRSPSVKVLGYPIEQLGYMRLIPCTNPALRFEFRKYTFLASQPIVIRTEGKKYAHLPDEEHIVLSTSDCYIFAILEYSGFFRAIYRRARLHPRVKINMISGAIDDMTPDDSRDCPVGKNCPISPKRFSKAFANTDSLKSECHPDSEYNPGSPSSSARQHSPHPSSAHGDSLIRTGSVSSPGRLPSVKVLGYTMEKLGYVRLIPSKNKNQRFQFRRYKFPDNKYIRMIIDNISYPFDLTREYIVVSTSNGDVFAILDYSGTLRGIYSTVSTHLRVKINMMSGTVYNMTPDEIRDCQVGKNYPIFPKRFITEISDHNSLEFQHNSTSERDSDCSPVRLHSLYLTPSQEHPVDSTSISPPGRPPSHEVLGIPLERLGYIRLIPEMNPRRRFEFRKYVFPPHRPIYLLSGYNKYVLMPTREYIVLSTSSGDIFAILEYTGILRGIYEANSANHFAFSRIRINMISGEVVFLTEFEIHECQVGEMHPIFPRLFNKIVSDEDSLKHVYQ